MIKYLGSKRTLVKEILELSKHSSYYPNSRILDVFSGTCRVSYAFKEQSNSVIANDITHFAHTFAKCYLEANRETHATEALDAINEFNSLQGSPGYFTETFCHRSRFFHPLNGERIDAIRELIEIRQYPEPLKSVLLTSLIEAIDAVDSTCGTQMAYLKSYTSRSLRSIRLRMPPLLFEINGCRAIRSDAQDVGKLVGHVDIAYIDPPYNQHSYVGNYHIWETLVLWDKPEVYGVACKRVDVKGRKSDFNSRSKIKGALKQTISNIDAHTYLVSFSNEGFLTQADIEEMLGPIGNVQVHEFDYKRYVGAQIGIHGRDGVVKGKVSHTRNKELIYVVQSEQ